ncbi:MAG: class I SAM-dependent methyltransferase [Candidatus Riflebacteria bacterium]
MAEYDDIDHYIRMSEEVFKPIYPFLCNSLLKRIDKDIDNLRVVDLGGGSGLWVESMLDMGAPVGYLVDVSEKMVNYARQRLQGRFGAGRFTSLNGSAEAIPLPDKSVDAVISRSSMHMWQNIEKGWAEIFRVLAPGGFAFSGRGYGPDLPEEIREQVKQARKKVRETGSDQGEEPPSPDPVKMADLLLNLGFSEVSLIKDKKVIWLLAKKPA